MANTRSENALNIINDKLDAMLKLKKEKLSTSDGADSGPAFMADLIVNGNDFIKRHKSNETKYV